MSNNRLQITNNLGWDVTRSPEAVAAFSEAGLAKLAEAGLDKAVKDADPKGLAARLEETKVNKQGSEGKIFGVKDSDDLLVKVHNRPFSYTGVNVALEEGLAGHERYRTPHYLGALMILGTQGGHPVQATIMTREPGIEVADLDDRNRMRYIHPVKDEIATTARSALASVGVDPNLAHWDLNDNNLLVPASTTDWAELGDVPVTILDQQANKIGGTNAWESLARPPFDPSTQDPRDILAEQAADEAWARQDATLTKV